jgi:predicted alpha/beta superfamily hydrolase
MGETKTDELLEVAELGRATLRGTKSFAIRSNIVDQTFLIDVAWPAAPVEPGQALPVVYVLDGNGSFALAAQTSWMLQLDPQGIPPMLIVGIGYQIENRAAVQPGSLRVRDLSPNIDANYLQTARNHEGPGRLPPGITPGGAADLLAFIDKELKPFIASRFPVKADDQTLMGISLGGLFTLNALFTSPQSFNRYIAGSPSIWWNGRKLLEAEAALAERVKDLPVRLFLAVGGLEERDSATACMVSNLYALEATLRRRAYPSLNMSMTVFPDETHMSVTPATMSRGLRAVFEDG